MIAPASPGSLYSPHTMENLSTTNLDIHKRMRTYVTYGVIFDAVQNLYRPFAMTYLDRLGGDERLMFLFNSLPALLAALVLIPALMLVQRIKNERHATALFFLFSRVFLLSFILVPLLPEAMQAVAFVTLFSLMSMPEAAGQSGMHSHLGHVFSSTERSTAIARRSRVSIPFSLAITIGTGLVLRYLPGTDSERIMLYQLSFLVAFLLALYELFTFLRLKGPVAPAPEPLKLRPALKSIRHNRAFLGFALASLVFHFGWQMGWPLFGVWHIKYLHADEWWLAVFTVVSSLTMFFAYGFWNRFQQRFGLALSLVACTLGQALNPFFIGAAQDLVLQAIFQIPTGFFTAGVVSIFLASILESTPNDNTRVVYFAVYNTFLYVSQVISQELGQILAANFGVQNAIFLDGGARLVGVAAFGYRAYRLRKKRA